MHLTAFTSLIPIDTTLVSQPMVVRIIGTAKAIVMKHKGDVSISQSRKKFMYLFIFLGVFLKFSRLSFLQDRISFTTRAFTKIRSTVCHQCFQGVTFNADLWNKFSNPVTIYDVAATQAAWKIMSHIIIINGREICPWRHPDVFETLQNSATVTNNHIMIPHCIEIDLEINVMKLKIPRSSLPPRTAKLRWKHGSKSVRRRNTN